jgi:hypothetical protein
MASASATGSSTSWARNHIPNPVTRPAASSQRSGRPASRAFSIRAKIPMVAVIAQGS